jgi:hypothetical protein
MKWTIKKINFILILAVITIAAESQITYIDLDIDLEDCFPSAGIKTNSINNNLEAFPNPTEGLFTISLDNSELSGTLEITVQNIQGQIIYSDEIELQKNSVKKEIDISGYPSGIYILNAVALRNGITIQKLSLNRLFK